MTHLRSFLSAVSLVAAASLGFAACGDDGATTTGTSSGGQGGEGAGSNNGVCLLHNCEINEHCEGCSEGRTACLVAEGRCVACGQDGLGCPEGQVCSSFGKCVPEGLECPTDGEGVPQISCSNSGDCAACSPAHQVCDPETNRCVGCTENDTAECQSTDVCKDGKCTQACAADCTVDNDCSKCTGAKACNKHRCSECSATYACPGGEICNLANGTCQKICGKPDKPGTCETDEECDGCADGTYVCKTPLNGGLGTCIPNAAGCSDLGDGALALPEPWNDYTNTCSNDNDCSNVGVVYNVGAALRDLIGDDEIVGQPIDDANITYPMAVCAAIEIADNSCGVCVPCREDADCSDIPIDDFTSDLFPGLGGILVDVALDALFGPNDHTIYMYCETIAAGYGVCAPCPGLLNDCGVGGGGGGGSGKCDHDPDVAGGPLDPTCGDCEETVCNLDSFCCTTEWDELCVETAASECGDPCHDECDTGPAMGSDSSCGSCAVDVCAEDEYCCETAWDSTCVVVAQDICSINCIQ